MFAGKKMHKEPIINCLKNKQTDKWRYNSGSSLGFEDIHDLLRNNA